MSRRYGLLAVALLVTVFAGARVFRPTDTVDPAHGRYPVPATATAVVYGELLHAPLIVAGRLRVYGAQNRVWADGPVDAKMSTSAYWAFRRWPAQLVGLVVTADRMVVSQWSDGQVVALHPETGRVAWRTPAGRRTAEYQGRRTGAVTVYAPPDLYTATTFSGRPVVVVVGGDAVTALDPDGGATVWRNPVIGDATCRNYFTVPGMLMTVDRCTPPSTVDIVDVATGRPVARPSLAIQGSPVGCAVARSECTGLAGDGAAGVLIRPDGTLTPAPGLSGRYDRLAGNTVVRDESDRVVAIDALTGTQLWSWPVPLSGTRVIAVESDRVHVLTPLHDMVTLDLATGSVRSAVYAHIPGTNEKPWTAGYVYASHGYVAIERLLPDAEPDAVDNEYYFPVPTLIYLGS